MKKYNVTFSYCVDVEAKDRHEAIQKAGEKFLTYDPFPSDMNHEVEEIQEGNKTFEIYLSDLSKEAQAQLCAIWNTTPEEENWDTMPLAVIERGDEAL